MQNKDSSNDQFRLKICQMTNFLGKFINSGIYLQTCVVSPKTKDEK